jgi:hypothetical protein
MEEDEDVYDEIEIEDMEYDESEKVYKYPCPCGDEFSISLSDMYEGENIATCPSCSLRIRVVFDVESLPSLEENATTETENSVEVKFNANMDNLSAYFERTNLDESIAEEKKFERSNSKIGSSRPSSRSASIEVSDLRNENDDERNPIGGQSRPTSRNARIDGQSNTDIISSKSLSAGSSKSNKSVIVDTQSPSGKRLILS